MKTYTYSFKTPSRLDRFLASRPNISFSRSQIGKHIKNENILVNKKGTKPSYMLKYGDEITLNVEPANEALPPNSDLNLDIIEENDNFLVINKPVGILTHPTEKNESGTIANALQEHIPQITSVGDDPMRPGIVHRLDKDTSGAMVIAKNQKTFDELKTLFKNREVKKTYTAIVHGHIEQKEVTIDTPIARAPKEGKQKIDDGHTKGTPRDALTVINPTKKVTIDGKNYTIIEALPKTGRTHQIRVHLSSIGHPVVGDKLYGTKKTIKDAKENHPHHLLHASDLEFTLNEQHYQFPTPFPKIFMSYLKG